MTENGGRRRRLNFLDQAGFKGLDRHPHALDLAAGQLDPDALQVGAELALGALRHVRADAAGCFGDAAAINNTTFGRAFARDVTDA